MAALAERQHGVVASGQLRGLGLRPGRSAAASAPAVLIRVAGSTSARTIGEHAVSVIHL